MSDFFSRLSALIRKEMLAIFKNPKSRVFVLLPPFIQIIIFGYAATLDLTNINYGFINRDRGSAAREVLAGFNGSGIFKPEAAPANEKAMADLINRKTMQNSGKSTICRSRRSDWRNAPGTIRTTTCVSS